jgi:Protein of unknown function (DUF3383)
MSLDPNGAPPGYYYQAGATAYLIDPAGTYSQAGARAPTTDPPGAYSAAGASAPTPAAAGTYILDPLASQYGLDRLFLENTNLIPFNEVLSFNSVTAVENYFGVGSAEAALATDYFSGYSGSSANMLFDRMPLGGGRARIFGANLHLHSLTLAQLRAINGTLSLTSQGYNFFNASINLASATSFASAASLIQSALNAVRPTVAAATGSSIAPKTASFTASIEGGLMVVTAVSSGQIVVGGFLSSANGYSRGQIIDQESGTPGGVGVYNVWYGGSAALDTAAPPGTALSETYGILTIRAVNSGTVAVGQEVTGRGVAVNTLIQANINGSGSGSTWVVDLAQTVAPEAITMKAAPLVVTNEAVTGATIDSDSFWIEVNDNYPVLATTMTYASGTAAASLGLTQSAGAYLSTPGQITTSPSAWLNNVFQNENSQWSSFQMAYPTASETANALSAWSAASGGQFQYLSGYTTTTPPIVPSSSAAEITDPAGTYSGAGASAPTTDPAGTYSGAGASAPTLAAPGTYIPVTGATSSAAAIVAPAGTYSAAGASAPSTDPAGTYSSARASGPTLAAAGTYIPVTGATSAAAEIVSPPGTYSPAGASAPIADPGGTYSAAGASAATTDPAGTYSSPYALNRLFLLTSPNLPVGTVLSFSSLTAVQNYFGASSGEAKLASDFFAGYAGTSATMLFTRYPYDGARSRVFSANLANLTRGQLQSIDGSLSLTLNGDTYSGHVNLSNVKDFSGAAIAIQNALNSDLAVLASTTGDSIQPESVSFKGIIIGDDLEVLSAPAGTINLGSQISGPGIPAGNEIVSQLDGTPGGDGLYNLFSRVGEVRSETMTVSYGVLTLGSVTSGTVAPGELLSGPGIASSTTILSNISGSGPRSTWVVNNAQTVDGASASVLAPSLDVENDFVAGATANRDFFDVSTAGGFDYDYLPSTISYVGGTAAAALGLTQGSGALLSNPGGRRPTRASS